MDIESTSRYMKLLQLDDFGFSVVLGWLFVFTRTLCFVLDRRLIGNGRLYLQCTTRHVMIEQRTCTVKQISSACSK